MENDLSAGTVVSGYETWIAEPTRAQSSQVAFGAWWRAGDAYWRLSWIANTRELFAVELRKGDRFVFLGNYEKRDINNIMRRWSDGNNFTLLLKQFGDRIAGVQALALQPAAL